MEINQQVAARTIISKPVNAVAEPLRVVVVDDSVEFLEVVSGLVELEDSIEVVGKATDGTEAIHAVAELSPDLVLMDVNMPYMNGLTAALLILQHFPGVKIILMSGDGSLQMRIACQSSGAQAFVYKPKFRSQFFEALEKVHGTFDTEHIRDLAKHSAVSTHHSAPKR